MKYQKVKIEIQGWDWSIFVLMRPKMFGWVTPKIFGQPSALGWLKVPKTS
jgi:hypothetical protein